MWRKRGQGKYPTTSRTPLGMEEPWDTARVTGIHTSTRATMCDSNTCRTVSRDALIMTRQIRVTNA
jgi:protoporphyrinogen oxidase